MRALVTLCLLALCLGAASCQRRDIRNVDTFDIGTNSITIQLSSSLTTSGTPVSDTAFFSSGDANSEDILGGERDLQLTVNSGGAGQVFSTSIIDGAWEVSTPTGRNNAPAPSSKTLIQYDGIDGSINLNTQGLGGASGFDLTFDGSADAFELEYESDFASEYVFEVHDVQGRVSRRTVPAPSGTGRSLTVLFSQFTGNANFRTVGAIVVTVDGRVDVDIVTELFAISGPLPSPSSTNTRTATPTRSPQVPSASRSNTPAPQEPSSSRTPSSTRSPPIPPSESRTPSRSPSPSPFPTCRCACPHFRCGVVYDVPDSDDDDEASSERIIYRPVFYYAANNDFDDVDGPNDGQTTWFAFSRKVAEFKPGQHDVPVYLYLSDANTITTSIALVLLSLLALVF